MSDTCKKNVWPRTGWPHPHPCGRKAVKDGYCKIHHPDAIKKREAESVARFKAKQESSPYALAMKKIKELERELAEAQAEIERMKPVVEVALLIYHNPTGVWLGRLFEACRKYEEGK